MQSILVATDFSERSNRAVRRAVLLAKTAQSRLVLLHAVDEDRPSRLQEIEQQAALLLLQETAARILEDEGIQAEPLVREGAPFATVTDTASEVGADLIAVGTPRRQLLQDVFIGTTAERIMRQSAVPVLMVSKEPAAYRHMLAAVDLSEASAHAARTAVKLGLDRHMAVSLLYLFDAEATGLMIRSATPMAEIRKYQDQEAAKAGDALESFLKKTGLASVNPVVRQIDAPVAQLICATAEELKADLIVVGTQGKSGVPRLLLGSVAEGVLRTAKQDVLAVPAVRPG